MIDHRLLGIANVGIANVLTSLSNEGRPQMFRRALETCTNVALIVVCIAIVWFAVVNRELFFHTGHSQQSSLIGKKLPVLDGDAYSAHKRTLVMALRKDCHFCQASMPFYRRLENAEQAGTLGAHIHIVVPDKQEIAAPYLAENGFDDTVTYDHPLDDLHVDGTPTLLLVDEKGTIQKAWIGQLKAPQEEEVLTSSK